MPAQRNSLRAALGNGYRNARFGAKLEPSLKVGRYFGLAFPRFRQMVDFTYRYLPRMDGEAGRRVLDIGSGSGAWLLIAREAGWSVAGADPDPIARSRAQELGLEVRTGGAEAWADQLGTFSAVTMSHVIEHVHDPVQTLRDALSLLRPGGRLYVETPNIDAVGHTIFGPNWRGLETPRHLVLFNHGSMNRALGMAGFVNIRYRRRPEVFQELSILSARMAAGLDPYAEDPDPEGRAPTRAQRLRSAFSKSRSEFLTLTCERPLHERAAGGATKAEAANG
jgi:SAM-dependent methyltransferase